MPAYLMSSAQGLFQNRLTFLRRMRTIPGRTESCIAARLRCRTRFAGMTSTLADAGMTDASKSERAKMLEGEKGEIIAIG